MREYTGFYSPSHGVIDNDVVIGTPLPPGDTNEDESLKQITWEDCILNGIAK